MTRRIIQLAIACSMTLIAGCAGNGQHDSRSGLKLSTKPDVVAYCHEAFLERIDLGEANQSHGDMVTWSADLFNEMPKNRKRADGKVVGIASGYMIVTRPNHEVGTAADTDREFRLSTMTMSWKDTDDSIIFTGLHTYGHDAPRLDNTVTRPIVGGTGRFLGQAGVAAVIPEGEAWFRVEIYLADHR